MGSGVPGPCRPYHPTTPNPTDTTAFELWKLYIKDHQMKLQEFENFKADLYSLVMGQCTEAMQDWLCSHQDFPAATQNGIALLVIIWSLIHTFEEKCEISDSLSDVKEAFYSFKQGKNMTLL